MKTTWKEFLEQHRDLIVAADFFTIEAWTRRRLQRFIVLFFIELSTRKVEIAGIAPIANGLWMNQIGRNLTDAVEGILKGKRYLIHESRPAVHIRVPEGARGDRCGIAEIACTKPESECLRGKVCAHDQGVVPGATDPIWRRLGSSRSGRIHCALSL